jgi:hypothetical protein
MIALSMLNLGGYCPPLPAAATQREDPRKQQEGPFPVPEDTLAFTTRPSGQIWLQREPPRLQIDVNRTIKTIKRVGCGFRNERSYRRRIMVHIAATAARRRTM